MQREDIYVEILLIEEFFLKTFKYLDDLKILFTKEETIRIAKELFDKISILSYVKSVSYEFVVELYEIYKISNQ